MNRRRFELSAPNLKVSRQNYKLFAESARCDGMVVFFIDRFAHGSHMLPILS
jgi:hypothetical protein